MKLVIAALIAITALASAADITPDVTGADAKTFKAHLGRVVSIRGRLEQGMQGACLFGATPKDIAFYVIPDVPPDGYSWPASWTRHTHHQIRVTGELKFRSFDRSHYKAGDQVPPDYYYMVLQRAEIQRLDSK